MQKEKSIIAHASVLILALLGSLVISFLVSRNPIRNSDIINMSESEADQGEQLSLISEKMDTEIKELKNQVSEINEKLEANIRTNTNGPQKRAEKGDTQEENIYEKAERKRQEFSEINRLSLNREYERKIVNVSNEVVGEISISYPLTRNRGKDDEDSYKSLKMHLETKTRMLIKAIGEIEDGRLKKLVFIASRLYVDTQNVWNDYGKRRRTAKHIHKDEAEVKRLDEESAQKIAEIRKRVRSEFKSVLTSQELKKANRGNVLDFVIGK